MGQSLSAWASRVYRVDLIENKSRKFVNNGCNCEAESTPPTLVYVSDSTLHAPDMGRLQDYYTITIGNTLSMKKYCMYVMIEE